MTGDWSDQAFWSSEYSNCKNRHTHPHTHKAVNSSCEERNILSLRRSRICNCVCSLSIHTNVGREHIFAASCSCWQQPGVKKTKKLKISIRTTSSIQNTTNACLISLSMLSFCAEITTRRDTFREEYSCLTEDFGAVCWRVMNHLGSRLVS